MSELINTRQHRAGIRRQLLTTVSAVALIASTYAMSEARAADSDRPPFWIELDGQFTQQETGQEAFLPPFILASPFDGASHAGIENGSPTLWDKGAKVTFLPAGSDWVFSLALRYGKNVQSETRNQVTTHRAYRYYSFGSGYDAYQIFEAQRSESHAIVDFQAGKDVGLGKFGSGGSSVFSAGVRIAQFNSRSHVEMKSLPTNVGRAHPHNIFYGSFAANRRFNGIGPSLSWDASANVVGVPNDGGISFDWGVNGAVLFGRQKVNGSQRTAENNMHTHYGHLTGYNVYQHSPSPNRSRQATVPNLGGFAGVSLHFPNAKVSIGYRADFFFGAMDGGIDTAHRENVGFYGPFASISVGIGG